MFKALLYKNGIVQVIVVSKTPFLGADSGAIWRYILTPYKPAPQLLIFINLTPLLL